MGGAITIPRRRQGQHDRARIPPTAPMALCMRARRDVATRCPRSDLPARAHGHQLVGRGGSSRRRATLRGWGPPRRGCRLARSRRRARTSRSRRALPTEPFERAGEASLAAARLVPSLPFTFIAGVSEATPREATRALASKDRATATKLAEHVEADARIRRRRDPLRRCRTRALLRSTAPDATPQGAARLGGDNGRIARPCPPRSSPGDQRSSFPTVVLIFIVVSPPVSILLLPAQSTTASPQNG